MGAMRQVVLQYDKGVILIPDEERERLHLLDGMHVLVSVASKAEPVWTGPRSTRQLPPWTWEPNTSWHELRGSLKDGVDTTARKQEERRPEREHDDPTSGFGKH